MSPQVLQNYLGLPFPAAFHFQTQDSSPPAPALALLSLSGRTWAGPGRHGRAGGRCESFLSTWVGGKCGPSRLAKQRPRSLLLPRSFNGIFRAPVPPHSGQHWCGSRVPLGS